MKNAVEILREGRLGAPYRARYDVVVEEGILKLRHYASDAQGPPLLLVPPLMVTSEVYDISPELSAIGFLAAQGIDVWVADFGAPEEEQGGFQRTVDDHVVAVDLAVEHIAKARGADVHIAGYSQGGMFAYIAAAYRRNANVASVITFGAPVDMRRNLPVKMHEDLASRLISAAMGATTAAISELEAMPSALTSYGFKLISPRQEVKHLVQMLGLLHDREALAKRLPQRRFLGGEGFVAWPGPALRALLGDMVGRNRMARGGLVVAGRTLTLHDVTVPILYFVGSRDEIARPRSVEAIERVAGTRDIMRVDVPAGHFGLVVGTKAMTQVWPRVVEWCKTGKTTEPQPRKRKPRPESAGARLYDLAGDVIDGLSHRAGSASREVVGVIDAMRWQLPRLARLASLHDDSRVSISRMFAEQAEAIPDAPFFLWEGRAFTFGEANQNINRAAHALAGAGVRRGHHVGVLMDNHPDYLLVVAALNRLGAVAVLLPQEARGASLEHALAAGDVVTLVAGPQHLIRAAAFRGPVLLVGADRMQGEVPAGVRVLDDDMESAPPAPVADDDVRAADLAYLLFTSGTTGLPKAARITNRRAILAALGSAAAAALTPADTVYCCLPLHHASGMLIAIGGAVAGGCRLALAPRFSTTTFWSDVRRAGATVVMYVGELCRYLVTAPPSPNEKHHPVRLFLGNGLRPDVWRALQERFGQVRVVEFYGSTEGNLLLVNLFGEKVGSVGRDLTGGAWVALVKYDPETSQPLRDDRGHAIRCAPGEPGLLVARVHTKHPIGFFDGYTDPAASEKRIERNLFARGDAWFTTGDVLQKDKDGDFWFVDRIGDTFRWKGENVSTDQVAQVLDRAPFVRLAAVYGVAVPGREGRAGMAAIELREGASFDGAVMASLVEQHLTPPARPRWIRIVSSLAMTETWKPNKQRLAEEGPRTSDPLYRYDDAAHAYVPLTGDPFANV